MGGEKEEREEVIHYSKLTFRKLDLGKKKQKETKLTKAARLAAFW